MKTRELVAEIDDHIEKVWCLAFSPKGKHLVSGSRDGTLGFWDLATPAPPKKVTMCPGPAAVYSLAFNSTGDRLLSGDNTGLSIWDVSKKQLVTTLRGHQSSIMGVAFSPDDKRIISGSYDGEIRIWESELESARKMWRAAARREK